MLCLMAWVMAASLCAFPASAVQINDPYPVIIHPQNNEICPIEDYNASSIVAYQQNREKYGIMKRMVYCVQGLVIPATYKIMYRNSVDYFYGPIAAACTLAVALWGVLMVMGKNSAPVRDAFTVALKIGSVSLFTFILGQSTIWPYGLFPVIIDVVDYFSSVVTIYVGYSTTMRCAQNFALDDIWGRVDCALNTLLGGIFHANNLLAGLMGFFVSAFVSGTFGMFIALIGFYIIFLLIMAILRATYITITAYVALALMAIISPVFITMILFKSTYGYFEKWLKLTVGFILQPIFLFAYLAMMLAAYDTVIYDGRFSVYRALVGATYIGAYPSPLAQYPINSTINPDGDFLIGYWMLYSGVYRKVEAASMGVGTNPRLQAHVAARNIGLLGSTGAEELPEAAFNRKDSAGILFNVLDNFRPINVYKVDIPVKRVGWVDLALSHLCTTVGCTPDTKRMELYTNICGGPNVSFCDDNEKRAYDNALYNIMLNYLIQLVLSLLLAMLTMYIFYLMIDLLPFIGSGISGGDKNSMPVLGANGLSMPGNKLIDKMKSGMGRLAGGGGGS